MVNWVDEQDPDRIAALIKRGRADAQYIVQKVLNVHSCWLYNVPMFDVLAHTHVQASNCSTQYATYQVAWHAHTYAAHTLAHAMLKLMQHETGAVGTVHRYACMQHGIADAPTGARKAS